MLTYYQMMKYSCLQTLIHGNDPWKEKQQLQKMKETKETTFLRNVFRNNKEFVQNGHELGARFANLYGAIFWGIPYELICKSLNIMAKDE